MLNCEWRCVYITTPQIDKQKVRKSKTTSQTKVTYGLHLPLWHQCMQLFIRFGPCSSKTSVFLGNCTVTVWKVLLISVFLRLCAPPGHKSLPCAECFQVRCQLLEERAGTEAEVCYVSGVLLSLGTSPSKVPNYFLRKGQQVHRGKTLQLPRGFKWWLVTALYVCYFHKPRLKVQASLLTEETYWS